MSLSREEKERILRALEEDREFRYAVMGLLGYREVLEAAAELRKAFARLEERQLKVEEALKNLAERQQRLEEHFARLEERQQRLEERFAELAERQQRLEERFARLEERQQRLEEEFKKLAERQLRLEERQQRLEERQQRLEERMLKVEERLARVEEAVAGLQRTLATVAHRFGVLSESAFREAVKGIVEDLFGATAFRWTAYDSEGVVYGHPSEVEVDVVVKDNRHLLVEVKSRVDAGDVLELVRIAKLYKAREGVDPELAIVAGFVSPKARRLAEKLGVRVYTYIEGGD